MRCLAIALLLAGCTDDPNDDDPQPGDEVCDNELDDDGDSAADCDDSDCAADPACQVEPTDIQLTTYHSFRGVQRVENAALVAFADGVAGEFQPLTGTDGVYDFTVTSPDGRYSLLVACEGRAGVRLHHGVATEGTALHVTGCVSVDTSTFPSLTFMGTFTGSPCVRGAVGSSGIMPPCDQGSWLAETARGLNDLVALGSQTINGAPDQILVEHGIDLVQANQAHVIDFANAAPVTTRTITGTPQQLTQAVAFNTRFVSANISPTADSYIEIPAAMRQPEDVHRWCMGNFNAESFCTYFRDPIDIVAADPPLPVVSGTASVASPTPYPLHQLDWELEGGDPVDGYRLELLGDPNRLWTVHISAGFLGGETVYQIPDLSAVAGFTEPLHPSPDAGWRIAAIGEGEVIDVANAFYLRTTAPDGLSYWAAYGFF